MHQNEYLWSEGLIQQHSHFLLILFTYAGDDCENIMSHMANRLLKLIFSDIIIFFLSVNAFNSLCSLLWVYFQVLDLLLYTLYQQMKLNPFPNKPWFLRVCSTGLLKTLSEKEKLLAIFSFSHCVFYLFGELSAILIEIEIVVCKLFQF